MSSASRPGSSRYSILVAPMAYHTNSPAEDERLLVEYDLKDTSDSLVFGKNNPTMLLEERMLE